MCQSGNKTLPSCSDLTLGKQRWCCHSSAAESQHYQAAVRLCRMLKASRKSGFIEERPHSCRRRAHQTQVYRNKLLTHNAPSKPQLKRKKKACEQDQSGSSPDGTDSPTHHWDEWENSCWNMEQLQFSCQSGCSASSSEWPQEPGTNGSPRSPSSQHRRCGPSQSPRSSTEAEGMTPL